MQGCRVSSELWGRDMARANFLRDGFRPITSATILIDHTGKPYTLSYLVNALHVGPNGVRSSYDPNSPVDVTVIAGDDWALKNP